MITCLEVKGVRGRNLRSGYCSILVPVWQLERGMLARGKGSAFSHLSRGLQVIHSAALHRIAQTRPLQSWLLGFGGCISHISFQSNYI